MSGFLISVLTRWPSLLIAESLHPRPRPAHVLFCMVDHYEPGTGQVDLSIEKKRMAELLAKYPPLADAHADASGQRPRRTWFFPPHYHRHGNLRELVSLCQQGYGEIELHLHHGKTKPDTPRTWAEPFACACEITRNSAYSEEDGRKRYGFIHGDFALKQLVTGRESCGVDSELSSSRRLVVMPILLSFRERSNPAQINSIYYANVNLNRPKAYASGVLAKAGAGPKAGLLMIQGPVRPVWIDGRLTFGDGINNRRPPDTKTDRRLDRHLDSCGWEAGLDYCQGAHARGP